MQLLFLVLPLSLTIPIVSTTIVDHQDRLLTQELPSFPIQITSYLTAVILVGHDTSHSVQFHGLLHQDSPYIVTQAQDFLGNTWGSFETVLIEFLNSESPFLVSSSSSLNLIVN